MEKATPDVSSPGNALPSIKTINVEANLLAEWLAKKGRQREEVVRYLALIGGIVVLTAATVPVLFGIRTSAATRAVKAEMRMNELATTLQNFQSQKEAASPRLAHQEMINVTKRQAETFLGSMVSMMNSASSDMAFADVQGDVLGGELTLRCKADAKDFATARQFVSQAAGGSRVNSAVLVSSRSSQLLGANGVSFEFIKRLEVGE